MGWSGMAVRSRGLVGRGPLTSRDGRAWPFGDGRWLGVAPRLRGMVGRGHSTSTSGGGGSDLLPSLCSHVHCRGVLGSVAEGVLRRAWAPGFVTRFRCSSLAPLRESEGEWSENESEGLGGVRVFSSILAVTRPTNCITNNIMRERKVSSSTPTK